jgi:hypothetical protein
MREGADFLKFKESVDMDDVAANRRVFKKECAASQSSIDLEGIRLA